MQPVMLLSLLGMAALVLLVHLLHLVALLLAAAMRHLQQGLRMDEAVVLPFALARRLRNLVAPWLL